MLTLTYQFQLQPNRQQEEEMSSGLWCQLCLGGEEKTVMVHAAWNCSGRTYRRSLVLGRRESRPGGTIAVALERTLIPKLKCDCLRLTKIAFTPHT